jgi:hypothetical protein
VRASQIFTAVAAAIAFVAGCHAPHSTDLFWQIPEGRRVLAGTIPHDVPWALGTPAWTDHEWLFEALAAWCYDHHVFALLVVLCALAAAAAPLLAYAAARDLGYDWASTSFAVLLVCASTAVSWSERPQNFVLLAFLAQLWLLWRGARQPLLLLPLACVWSNLHASGVLAPVVCLLFAAAYAIAGGIRDVRVRRCAVAALAALAGTFVTPHGVRLWSYALDSLADRNHSHRYIAEWQPLLNDGVPKPVMVWLLLIAVVLAGALVRRRDELAPVLVGVVFLALPLLHARFILFSAAAALPLIAGSLRALVGALPQTGEPRMSRAMLAVPVAGALAGIWIAVTSPALGSDPVDTDAATLLTRHHVSEGIFAEYTAAAYLAAFVALPVQVSVDAHGDPFGTRAWDDEYTLEHAFAGWEAALRRQGIETVVLPADHPLISALQSSPHWTGVDRTAHVRMFVRRPVGELRSVPTGTR